ncbi:MAG: hypothetical protein RL641_3 [Candidatus Parcubacteria bacterium]|jgi:hypothetical protein
MENTNSNLDKNFFEFSRVLNEISNEILFKLRTKGVPAVLDSETHNVYQGGFDRTQIKKELLERWRGKIDIDRMSVEIISVHTDMSDHIHYHADSYAVLTLLGKWEGLPEPGGVYCFSSKEFLPAVSGVTIQVAPGVVHGFSAPGSKLSFLSVQSEKIDKDYHIV